MARRGGKKDHDGKIGRGLAVKGFGCRREATAVKNHEGGPQEQRQERRQKKDGDKKANDSKKATSKTRRTTRRTTEASSASPWLSL